MYVCLLIICLWYISKLFKTNILYRIDTGVILRLLLFAPLLLLQYGSAAVSFIASAQTDSRHRGLTELLRPLCPTATLLLQNVSQGKVWKPPGTASDRCLIWSRARCRLHRLQVRSWSRWLVERIAGGCGFVHALCFFCCLPSLKVHGRNADLNCHRLLLFFKSATKLS